MKGRGDLIKEYKSTKEINKDDVNKVLVIVERGRALSNWFKCDKFKVS